MTTARCKIVDLDVTRYYHCISRCVRGAFLCGHGFEHRKEWIENRIERLAACFAISVAGFSVMDNHLHLLVRVDPEVARAWTAEEVLVRWIAIYPPSDVDLGNADRVREWLQEMVRDVDRINEYRQRLTNLGWFMKSLKEPLARLANREDDCRGTFWEARYKSIAVLDEEAILATCAYIDLNPVAAGLATTPESSTHTSIKQRVTHVARKRKLKELGMAKKGSVPASRKLGNAEQDHWLIPFEDRRLYTNSTPVSKREGMLEKFTLGNYLMLVEYTGRLLRKGKVRISQRVQQVFKRLNTSLELWTHRVKGMLTAKKLRGRCFAAAIDGIKSDRNPGLTESAINLKT